LPHVAILRRVAAAGGLDVVAALASRQACEAMIVCGPADTLVSSTVGVVPQYSPSMFTSALVGVEVNRTTIPFGGSLSGAGATGAATTRGAGFT
jgi:hypothetical protein